MTAWVMTATDLLWRNAIVAVPLVLTVGAVCRWAPIRPATRHILWLCVLASLVVGLVLPPISFSGFRDARASAATKGIKGPRDQGIKGSGDQGTEGPRDQWIRGSGDQGTEGPRATTSAAAKLWHRRLARDPTGETPVPQGCSQPCSLPQHSSRDARASTLRDTEYPGAAALGHPSPTPPWTVARAGPTAPPQGESAAGSAGLLSTIGDRLQADDTSRIEGPNALVAAATPVQGTSRSPVAAKPGRRSPPTVPMEAAPTIAAAPAEAASAAPTTPGPAKMLFHNGGTGVPPVEQGNERSVNHRIHRRDTGATQGSETVSILSRWVAGLVDIRDAVGRLPTIPPGVWAGGVLLVVAIRLHQILRFRRRLRRAAPAPRSIVGMVAETAQMIGLRSAPETVVVRDRISPMVWCGRKAILVLPRELWSELDEVGRRAVLLHELAHIRRRDHLICWIDWVIGAVYWWHPFIWWARGRLREESENCCDAWVTWLLPRGRRAYAEVLLQTRQFVSEPCQTVPSTGLTIARRQTKRFARRLTMVMTKRMTPKTSFTGIVLALTVVVGGWVAMPAWSSEPGETAPEASTMVVVQPGSVEVACEPKVVCEPKMVAGGVQARTSVTVRPTVTVTPPSVAVPLASTAWTLGSASWQGVSAGPGDLEKRIERLERQLDRLSKQLDRLAGGMPPMPDMPEMPPMPPMPEMPEMPSGLDHWGAAGVTAWKTIVRTYELPEGRLKALTALMVRPDVPTRVRSVDGGIEVHGTAADHATFKAFVDTITIKEDMEVGYRLPEGKLKALTTLMERSDVPVLVSEGKGKIVVHGDGAVQSVFRAFVEMINPSEKASAEEGGRAGGRSAAAVAEYMEQQAKHQRKQAERTARHEERRARFAMKTASRHHREFRKLMQMVAELVREAEEVGAQAERLERDADRLFDEAEELREKASDTDNRKKAARLNDKARQMEHEAEAIGMEARRMFEKAEALESEAEEVEDRAEDLAEDEEDEEEDEDDDHDHDHDHGVDDEV